MPKMQQLEALQTQFSYDPVAPRAAWTTKAALARRVDLFHRQEWLLLLEEQETQFFRLAKEDHAVDI